MKAFALTGILLGVLFCAAPEIVKWFFAPETPQILEPDTFWKVNGLYANEGEIFEVFDPPLGKIP